MKIGGFYFREGQQIYLPVRMNCDDEDIVNAIHLLAELDGILGIEEIRDDDCLREVSIYFSRGMYFPFLTDGKNGDANYFTLNNEEFGGSYVIDFTGESFPSSAATKNLDLIKLICLDFNRGLDVSKHFEIRL